MIIAMESGGSFQCETPRFKLFCQPVTESVVDRTTYDVRRTYINDYYCSDVIHTVFLIIGIEPHV